MASQDTAASRDTAWSGWIVFAAFVLIIVGAMDILQGFVAIIKDEYVVATAKGVAILDVTGWGWATLIWGALLIIVGLGLLAASGWARWLAIIGVSRQCDRADRVHGQLPPGVSALEHPDRRAQHPRALCADGTLDGLQGVFARLIAASGYRCAAS